MHLAFNHHNSGTHTHGASLFHRTFSMYIHVPKKSSIHFNSLPAHKTWGVRHKRNIIELLCDECEADRVSVWVTPSYILFFPRTCGCRGVRGPDCSAYVASVQAQQQRVGGVHTPTTSAKFQFGSLSRSLPAKNIGLFVPGSLFSYFFEHFLGS